VNCRGPVVKTRATYSGGPVFESQSGDRVSYFPPVSLLRRCDSHESGPRTVSSAPRPRIICAAERVSLDNQMVKGGSRDGKEVI
jgi:hypothetical protein